MKMSEISDRILCEMYKNYDIESDFNGAIGISLASEIESRAGMGLESKKVWMENVKKYGVGHFTKENHLSSKETALLNYVEIAEKENLMIQNSFEALKKKKDLLHQIGVHNLYVKKPAEASFPLKCPIDFAREDQICSVFNKYYFQGIRVKEKYGLK